MAKVDFEADWVDLSVDDFSTIGQFLLEDGGSLTIDSTIFDEDDEDEDEEGQQVIQIDGSIGLPEEVSSGAGMRSQLADLVAENERLKQELATTREAHAAAAKTAALAAEREAERIEAERSATESREAVSRAAEAAATAEAALSEARARAENETSLAAVEVARSAERAAAAESLVAALNLQLEETRSSAEADKASARQEAAKEARASALKEAREASHAQVEELKRLAAKLTMERDEASDQLKRNVKAAEKAKATREKNEVKAAREVAHSTQQINLLKRQLEAALAAQRASEASYEELLKTLGGSPATAAPAGSGGGGGWSSGGRAGGGGSGAQQEVRREGGLSPEERAVLGQACREAMKSMRFEEDEHEAEAAATAGAAAAAAFAASRESEEKELEDDQVTCSSAALVLRKLGVGLAEAHSSKVAIEGFRVGEVAMFFPIPKKSGNHKTRSAGVGAAAAQGTESEPLEYVAFTARRARTKYFLSAASRALIGKSAHFKDAYVLGKVVHKEKVVATEEDYRRLHLKPGSEYYSLTVSALPFD